MTAEPATTPAVDAKEHLVRAGVPARFLSRSFGSFEVRPGARRAFEASQAAAEADDRGLVLVGPPGSGKTHLAVSIVRRRIERWLERFPEQFAMRLVDGAQVMHVRPPHGVHVEVVPSLLDRIRTAIGTDESDPLAPLRAARLLVLDDLGAKSPRIGSPNGSMCSSTIATTRCCRRS